MDIDGRMQLFDLKKKYQFQTTPGVDRYNMPLYSVQNESEDQQIGMYPVYQGFLGPAYINGVPVGFYTQKENFFTDFPKIIQNMTVVGVGNGSSGPYTLQLPILSNTLPPNPPFNGIVRGHIDTTGIISTGTNVDPPLVTSDQASDAIADMPVTSVDSAFFITSIDATGANVVVADSGQFLTGNVNYGLLMSPGKAPYGNTALTGGYSTSLNTINYFSGAVTLNFPVAIPQGVNINAQAFYFQSGLPRGILFYDNCLTLRMPPSQQWLVELDAYLSPAAFLNTNDAIPFAYMAEYIARGAARKILSDTGDVEQFQFYEPLFKEQELLVWKRSGRQFTTTRTETIYSRGKGFYNYGFFNNGIGTTQ